MRAKEGMKIIFNLKDIKITVHTQVHKYNLMEKRGSKGFKILLADNLKASI